jgi:hypothetical protein
MYECKSKSTVLVIATRTVAKHRVHVSNSFDENSLTFLLPSELNIFWLLKMHQQLHKQSL